MIDNQYNESTELSRVKKESGNLNDYKSRQHDNDCSRQLEVLNKAWQGKAKLYIILKYLIMLPYSRR